MPSVTLSATGLAMPGVNLDFLPASEVPEALGSPDSACAESGLEEMIGDLLAHEQVEDEEELFCKKKLELTLRCAVGEIHSDLQAFGKRVDARLMEAAAQVAPLVEAFARLREENTKLKIQQEKLIRQVEALCQVMGVADPSLHVLSSEEGSHSIQRETRILFSNFLTSSKDFPMLSSDSPTCAPWGTALETPCDPSSCTPQESPSSLPQDTPASTLEIPSRLHQVPVSCLQDSVSAETSTLQILEPSPIPHPPTFASRRSLSAPSLMANTSYDDNMVLLSVNGSGHDLC